MGTSNPLVTRKLTCLSDTSVIPFQPFIYGRTNFPLQMAVKYGVPLIMYGENGEVEYSGDINANVPNEKSKTTTIIIFQGYLQKHRRGSVSQKLIYHPSWRQVIAVLLKIIPKFIFSYYKFWDPQGNYYYCKQHTNFEPNPERSEGTFSKYTSLDDKIDGFHYYLSYIKFGIGRATSDTTHESRDDKITREEGVALVKRYDHEFPKKYFAEFWIIAQLAKMMLHEIIDSWQSSTFGRRGKKLEASPANMEKLDFLDDLSQLTLQFSSILR